MQYRVVKRQCGSGLAGWQPTQCGGLGGSAGVPGLPEGQKCGGSWLAVAAVCGRQCWSDWGPVVWVLLYLYVDACAATRRGWFWENILCSAPLHGAVCCGLDITLITEGGKLVL
jgi:hypothetical protein